MSYEKFVMDADFCGALHTYLAGITVDDNSLAMSAFEEVGPGSHFFGSQHTLQNYETAFWDSNLADNEPFEKWEANGSHDAAFRANKRWKKMLEDYEQPPLDVAVDEELQSFHRQAQEGDGGCLVLDHDLNDPLLQPFQLKHLTLAQPHHDDQPRAGLS